MAKAITSSLTKWLPLVAIFGGFYQVYQVRGLDGLMSDIKAITLAGIKAKWEIWLTAIALFVLARPISITISRQIGGRDMSGETIRPIILAFMYYIGVSQLCEAIAQGAGYGGGGRGWTTTTGPRTFAFGGGYVGGSMRNPYDTTTGNGR